MKIHGKYDLYRITIILIFISALLYSFLEDYINLFSVNIPILNDYNIITIAVIYTILYKIFDNYIWKICVWKFCAYKILGIPYLEGNWKGYIKSSHTNIECELEIKQSFSEITLNLSTENSKSQSLNAVLNLRKNKKIFYTYVNKPKNDSKKDINMHEGTVELDIVSNNKLEGNYYTGRDRKTMGSIKFEKIK